MSYSLHRDVPVPMYYQLKLQLQADIREGRLRPGDMLPPECELCEQLGVSRPTVRQAMSELVAEGLLTRRKGKGTFVTEPARRPVEARFLQGLQSFNEEIRQKQMEPSTKVLCAEVVEGSRELCQVLQLPLGAPLIHLLRLRFADGDPLVVVDTWLSQARFPGLEQEDFVNENLYPLMESRYGVRVDCARRRFEAADATPGDAALLEMETGRAVCFVRTVGLCAGEPVEYSLARYRGDRNTFTVEVYR